MAIVGLASCDPVDSDDHSLGAEPQENQLAFSATPTAGKANIVEFKNESTVEGVVLWDLGNGGTAKGESVKAQYPFKGEYTVAMTLYTTGGSATISKVISIADDDMALLDTPMYNALTGGAANLGGKHGCLTNITMDILVWDQRKVVEIMTVLPNGGLVLPMENWKVVFTHKSLHLCK